MTTNVIFCDVFVRFSGFCSVICLFQWNILSPNIPYPSLSQYYCYCFNIIYIYIYMYCMYCWDYIYTAIVLETTNVIYIIYCINIYIYVCIHVTPCLYTHVHFCTFLYLNFERTCTIWLCSVQHKGNTCVVRSSLQVVGDCFPVNVLLFFNQTVYTCTWIIVVFTVILTLICSFLVFKSTNVDIKVYFIFYPFLCISSRHIYLSFAQPHTDNFMLLTVCTDKHTCTCIGWALIRVMHELASLYFNVCNFHYLYAVLYTLNESLCDCFFQL